MQYLVGPGRFNEHEEQHLIGGDPVMLAWYDDNHLDAYAASAIGKYLDEPRAAFGVEVNGGHVWHCSLSIAASEGVLSDDKWQEIADDFVAGMGFDDADGVKAPCRWVAVRHGVSGNGNDHIHLAVNLVREDGTKASIHNDFKRAQKVARELETKHDLEPLESLKEARATRSYDERDRGSEYDAAEARAVRKAKAVHAEVAASSGGKVGTWEALSGADQQARIAAQLTIDRPRFVLERAVRGAATAATDEAEFVRRMRQAGIMVRPRFVEGTTDVVSGFSVAQRPPAGERATWYGAGQLDKSLRLPRLREQWESSPESAGAAAAEWTAAKRNQRPVAPGVETTEIDPALLRQCADEVAQLREQLRSVPVNDHATWSQVARQTSGAFASWSQRVEAEPGPLARTADTLARAARTTSRPIAPAATSTMAIGQAARLLRASGRGGDSAAAQLAVLIQLANLAKALHDTAQARGHARAAAEIASARRVHLQGVMDRLQPSATPATAAGAVATLDPKLRTVADAVAAGKADEAPSVLPRPLAPERPNVRTGPGQSRPDIER